MRSVKKSTWIIFLTCLFCFISALVYYIISARESFYQNDCGTSIAYGNKDILILAIMFFFFLMMSIYFIYQDSKKASYNRIGYWTLVLNGAIGGIYCLSTGIKKALKGTTCDIYFVLMALSILICVLGIALILDSKRKYM